MEPHKYPLLNFVWENNIIGTGALTLLGKTQKSEEDIQML